VESDILDAARFGLVEIIAAGVATIRGDLPRRRAATGDVAVEHRQEPLGVGRDPTLAASRIVGRCHGNELRFGKRPAEGLRASPSYSRRSQRGNPKPSISLLGAFAP
jgi:hypothetical protein